MSDQHRRPYAPTPERMAESTRTALLDAAGRSVSLRVLLNHVAYLEEQLAGIKNLLYQECMARGEVPRMRGLAVTVEEYARDLQAKIRAAEEAPPPIMVMGEDGQWRPEVPI